MKMNAAEWCYSPTRSTFTTTASGAAGAAPARWSDAARVGAGETEAAVYRCLAASVWPGAAHI